MTLSSRLTQALPPADDVLPPRGLASGHVPQYGPSPQEDADADEEADQYHQVRDGERVSVLRNSGPRDDARVLVTCYTSRREEA